MENENFEFESTADEEMKQILAGVQDITANLEEIFDMQKDIKRQKDEMKDEGIELPIVNKAMMLIKREITEEGDEKIERAMELKEKLMADPLIRSRMYKIYKKEPKV